MRKAFGRLLSIIIFSDLHGIRFVLGLSELIWAVTLLWPGHSFERTTYEVMALVMSENAWGFVFLVSGITQFHILLSGNYHSKFATYFAGWNLCLWMYVVISIYMCISPPPAAISGEAALALAAGWVWTRSGHIITGRRTCDYIGTSDRLDGKQNGR